MTKNELTKSKKVEVISSYWACNIDFHRHKTEQVANECIQKNLEKSSKPKPTRWTEDGYLSIIEIHNSGLSYVEIGKRFGISGQQAKNLVYKIYRILKKKNSLAGVNLKLFDLIDENGNTIDVIAANTKEEAKEHLDLMKASRKRMYGNLKVKGID